MQEQIPPILRPDHVAAVSLKAIAAKFQLSGDVDAEALVTGISMNTGDLRPGDLFVAMPGLKTHGARFVGEALDQGAPAVITDAAGVELIRSHWPDSKFPLLVLDDPRSHLGELAAFVYSNDSGTQPLIFGTTGTNGKTSTTYLLEAVARAIGQTTGLTTTAERHIAGEVIVSRLTTPESPEMQALIARMRERGATSIAIEVSAQALTQQRVDGIFFNVAGFTNLSHDHFDDYGDFETYLRAKAELFTKRRAERGVISLDSAFGAEFASRSQIPFVTITSQADVRADWKVKVTAQRFEATDFVLTGPDDTRIESSIPLLGEHMAANAGLAIVMLIQAGFDANEIQRAIAQGIDAYLPGRTELVSSAGAPAVFVDFGHSPDAFEKTLSAIRAVTPGRLIMIFGADGDRDASKRPDMARVAANGSDALVITDHHPRFEDPASIRKTLMDAAIEARPGLEIYEVSPPEAAIRKAVSLAKPGDAVYWAGPGHQDYRDIRGVRTPYSARAEARAALREHGWA
jgi:UDP-N-acetylmuramoyl-L-alanyl-D-glutamate--2,6-diaminopimelate ligase